MEQSLLRIKLPAQKTLYASRFRELLARECNLPPAFFHRAEDGRTLSGAPVIRVVGGKTWVGILGDGEVGAGLVEMATGGAIRCVQKELNVSTAVTLEVHKPEITSTETLNRYWVREMVVKRRTPSRREATAEVLAEELVLKHLKKAAIQYGLDESILENDLMYRVEAVNRPRGLRISTTAGDTNEFATLMDVEFVMNRNITGIWCVGNLTSRGYGRIGRNLDALKNGPARERESLK